MGQRVALGLAAVVGYGFVAAGEAYWLERQKAYRLGIIQRELDDSSNLFIVDAVYDCYHRDDFYSGFVEVFDRLQLYVEQVAYHAVSVGGVADSVELEVGVAHACFYCLLAELKTFCEFDSVGRGLHGVVSNFSRVTNCVQEVWAQRGLAAGELHAHLPARLDGDGVVEHGLDFFPLQFVDEAYLVRVHEAGIAHHVAAVGQIDGEDRAASVFHGRRSVMVELFVVVGSDVAAGENIFEMLGEFGIDRHHVFEVAVLRAVLDHQDLAVAFDDGGFDLAYLFVHQNFVRQFAVEDLLTDFRDTLRAQRIGGAGPAEGWLRLFVGLEQRFVGPFRGG